jgi:hypothetical protein
MTGHRVQVPIDGALKVTVDSYIEKQGGSRAQAVKTFAELGARLWEREKEEEPLKVTDRELLEELMLLVRSSLNVINVTHSQTFSRDEMLKNYGVSKELRDKLKDKALSEQVAFLSEK